ncbi:nascent polypeptide-associated complex subunit alpha, muscle-specific form-like [Eublepharis macularius]|uniref:Nascent polypeptide-associated complex subunit alpha, muscle-specific form-like n=1 Tax=Eublepharis macularius TaxID=481883 RepID=A0AA97KA24_EUBMA|nr:nascent polypeptide-associated complex subunit alpha, muscle-specific form-like [Eublepharis macularius]
MGSCQSVCGGRKEGPEEESGPRLAPCPKLSAPLVDFSRASGWKTGRRATFWPAPGSARHTPGHAWAGGSPYQEGGEPRAREPRRGHVHEAKAGPRPPPSLPPGRFRPQAPASPWPARRLRGALFAREVPGARPGLGPQPPRPPSRRPEAKRGEGPPPPPPPRHHRPPGPSLSRAAEPSPPRAAPAPPAPVATATGPACRLSSAAAAGRCPSPAARPSLPALPHLPLPEGEPGRAALHLAAAAAARPRARASERARERAAPVGRAAAVGGAAGQCGPPTRLSPAPACLPACLAGGAAEGA